MAKISLKRNISVGLLTFYGLGNILGAGIYVLVGKVAAVAGIWAPVSFLVASVVAGITAFAYAELSARYPVSAGEAIYIWEGFKLRWLSILVGLLIVLAGIVSSATIIHGFTGYLHQFLAIPDQVSHFLVIIVLTLVACWGIKESVSFAAFLTILELAGLLLIIFVGVTGDNINLPEWNLIGNKHSPGDLNLVAGIVSGAFLAFYAYIGFEDMVNVAEEVKDPQRTLPKAIFLALMLSAVLYATVVYIAISVVPVSELALSNAPLADIYAKSTGKEPYVISLIGLSAVINGALIQIIMGSRILFGMANKGWLYSGLAVINPVTRTPINATLIVALLILLFTLTLPIVTLAEFTSLLILVVFSLVNAALIMIKKTIPNPPRVQIYPIWIPYLGLLTTIILVAGRFLVGKL